MPQLLERAGPGTGEAGDITGIYTVLVDGDDMNDPIADAVRGIIDGHVVLDRQIAERGRFPAIHLLRKRLAHAARIAMPRRNTRCSQAARRMLAKYADMEELIRIGAYKTGADPETDASKTEMEAAPGERNALCNKKSSPSYKWISFTGAFAIKSKISARYLPNRLSQFSVPSASN